MPYFSLLPPTWGGAASEARLWKDISDKISRFAGTGHWELKNTRLAALNRPCASDDCTSDHPCLKIESHHPGRRYRIEEDYYVAYFCGPGINWWWMESGDDEVAGTFHHERIFEDVRIFTLNLSPAPFVGGWLSMTLKLRNGQLTEQEYVEFENSVERLASDNFLEMQEGAKAFLDHPNWSSEQVTFDTAPIFCATSIDEELELTNDALRIAGYREKWPSKAVRRCLLVIGEDKMSDEDLGTLGFHTQVLSQPVTDLRTFKASHGIA